MPPKKATTKAKATPARASGAARASATVTDSKGKEVEATAAVDRPRRAAAVSAPASTPAPKPKKTAPVKKAAPAKKAASTTTTTTTGKKRGRPTKAAKEEDDAPEPPKKRGRKDAPAVPISEAAATPKKRGRPPKGGETTKIKADDAAAAEQLEEELVDRAEAVAENGGPSKQAPLPKKRGRPANGKGKAATVSVEIAAQEEADADAEDDVAEGAPGKRYWLMKAEQEDRMEELKDGSSFNTKFTIDDLRAKGGPEPWDGVRNPTACKNMKDMKLGDLAFFYASGGKKGRQPGIVGIMEVVQEAEPDTSAFDENHPYYVEKATNRGTEAKPRWFMVHVEYRKKLSSPVTLKELQKYSKGEGVLANMQEFKAARLSVSKVTEEEWNFIVEKLIEGYEAAEDGAALPTTS